MYFLPLSQGVAKVGVRGAVIIEIRPQRQHDNQRASLLAGARGQVLDEGPPLGLGRAEREQLFKLVDEEKQARTSTRSG